MNKKDRDSIARVFAREMSLAGGAGIERRYVISGLARMIATELEHNDSRFNRAAFLQACGVQP